MKPDKKKIAALILAKMKPQEESDNIDFVDKGSIEETDEDDSSVAKKSAAEDLLSAISNQDSEMFLEAFENLVEMCKDYSEND